MKIVSYNILGESDSRLDLILKIIKSQSPDFLAIQEANYFIKNNYKLLKDFSKDLELPFYEISLASEYEYHVASFSKFPFKEVHKLKGFRNACLETVIDSPWGEISICNTHLTPYTEDERREEAKFVIKAQKKYKNKIVLGDLNSLSIHDNYKFKVATLHDSQHRKFTKAGKLQFEVMSLFEKSGYIDSMVRLGINNINTVPTPISYDSGHGKMRIDYFLVSESLIDKIIQVEVIKNELTDKASDHYPIAVALNNNESKSFKFP